MNMNHIRWRRVAGSGVVAAAASIVAAGGGAFGAATAAAATTCTTAGATGMTAAVVATSHQRITGQTIDATGCDIGIYVGPGVTHVRISDDTVEGANFQGILAENTSHLRVSDSTVTNNGFNTLTTDTSAPALGGNPNEHSFVTQSFGISLFGVSHSVVAGNNVNDNGRGGIGVMDDGPNNPGTIAQDTSAPLTASSHDAVVGNQSWNNYNGCGIVLATQNVGGELDHMLVAGNTVTGQTGVFTQNGPVVGGIVVAADPPNSSVTNVSVTRNTVTDSFEGGVIVNAEAFNSYTRKVKVTANTVSGNNWGNLEAPNTAGIVVYANPTATVPGGTAAPANVDTVVAFNTATNQFYGVWSTGNYPPVVFRNDITVSSGGTPIYPVPAATGNNGKSPWQHGKSSQHNGKPSWQHGQHGHHGHHKGH